MLDFTLYLDESADEFAKVTNIADALALAKLYIDTNEAEVEIDFHNGWKWMRFISPPAVKVAIGMPQDAYIPASLVERNRLVEMRDIVIHASK